MANQDGGTPAAQPERQPQRPWWRVVGPYFLTGLVAVALSFGLQWLSPRPAPQIIVYTTPQAGSTSQPADGTPTQPAAPTSEPAASTTPATSAPAPDAAILRQELNDLRYGQSQLWAAIYLSKAINQIADAERLLRNNDLQRVDQVLIAVDDALAQAYTFAASSVQSPIQERRREVDGIRDDLFIYPEQIEERLVQLRQLVQTLIEQPG